MVIKIGLTIKVNWQSKIDWKLKKTDNQKWIIENDEQKWNTLKNWLTIFPIFNKIYICFPESYHHHLVKVNDTHVVLLSPDDDRLGKRAYIFNNVNQIWKRLPNMRYNHGLGQAGLVTFDNGDKAVLVAGQFVKLW